MDNQLEDYTLDSRIVFAAEKVLSSELGQEREREKKERERERKKREREKREREGGGWDEFIFCILDFVAVAPMVDAAVIIRRPNAHQRITIFEYVERGVCCYMI